jgi:hypothetical protein
VRTHLQTEPSIASLATEVVWQVSGLSQWWDFDPNTGRTVVAQTVEATTESTVGVTVIVNWFEELLKRMGGN